MSFRCGVEDAEAGELPEGRQRVGGPASAVEFACHDLFQGAGDSVVHADPARGLAFEAGSGDRTKSPLQVTGVSKASHRVHCVSSMTPSGPEGDISTDTHSRPDPARPYGRVIRATSSASSSCSSVRSPRSTYPISSTTCRIVFSSASAVLATVAAFS